MGLGLSKRCSERVIRSWKNIFTEKSQKTQAREEKARIELEKIKIHQEKKQAEEEKVQADPLVAQIAETRNKLSDELQRTKAALEEEK